MTFYCVKYSYRDREDGEWRNDDFLVEAAGEEDAKRIANLWLTEDSGNTDHEIYEVSKGEIG